MKYFNIEEHLLSAVTNTVPDVLDNILSECEDRKGKVIEMKIKNANKGWVKPLCTTAAALALLVGAVFGAGQYKSAHAVDSVVSLDVNPSIEIESNKNEVVVAVRGLNEDGESILQKEAAEGTKLEGEELETVAKKLVSSMVEEGYLTELANSVLVSVDNADPEKSEAIENTLMEAINSALSENGIDGAVIGQTISENEELSAIAKELGISLGKTSLISSIIENRPELSYEELAGLSINDLSLIAEKWAGNSKDISIIGTPSDKKYVSAEFAIENACSSANLTIGDIAGAEAKIEYADGKLVYGVKMKIGETEVNCKVDAKSGEIVSIISEVIGAAAAESGNNGTATGGTSGSPGYQGVLTDTISDAVEAVVDQARSGEAADSTDGNTADGSAAGTPDFKGIVEDIISDGVNSFINELLPSGTGSRS